MSQRWRRSTHSSPRTHATCGARRLRLRPLAPGRKIICKTLPGCFPRVPQAPVLLDAFHIEQGSERSKGVLAAVLVCIRTFGFFQQLSNAPVEENVGCRWVLAPSFVAQTECEIHCVTKCITLV